MQIENLRNPEEVAVRAAEIIAAEARASVAARGRFVVAFSGGRTPAAMLRALAEREMPWSQTFVFQVDERVVPDGDLQRNLVLLRENLIDRVPLPKHQVYAMPVENSDLESAARLYMRSLSQVAGTPATLDCVHLGLGKDGHTASLVPADSALDITEVDVAPARVYEGTRRLTLTFPILNRARRVLWVVVGPDKVDALSRLRAGDPAIPAGRVHQDRAIILTDLTLTPFVS
jgi:6-phosphogluconolactonase